MDPVIVPTGSIKAESDICGMGFTPPSIPPPRAVATVNCSRECLVEATELKAAADEDAIPEWAGAGTE